MRIIVACVKRTRADAPAAVMTRCVGAITLDAPYGLAFAGRHANVKPQAEKMNQLNNLNAR